MTKKEFNRININVPVQLLDRIDEYALKNGLNRTTAILVLCNQSLNNELIIDKLPQLLEISKNYLHE